MGQRAQRAPVPRGGATHGRCCGDVHHAGPLRHVYHTHFNCNRRAIHEYEHLWPYLRDLYQLPGVADTVNLDHITEHYYTTHPT